MKGRGPRNHRAGGLVARRPATLFLFALALAAALASTQNTAGADPFADCMAVTAGDGEACLERQGGWYDWTSSEAACRFVGEKVDAIIAAGGDAKWADLFRNERCARHGMPHGPVAAANGQPAANGDRVLPPKSYPPCLLHLTDCDEAFGRHANSPDSTYDCPAVADRVAKDYRANKWPLKPGYPFFNERCWRLGLPHFDPD